MVDKLPNHHPGAAYWLLAGVAIPIGAVLVLAFSPSVVGDTDRSAASVALAASALLGGSALLATLPRLRAMDPRRRRQWVVIGAAVALLAGCAWAFVLLFAWLYLYCAPRGCLE